MKQTAKIAHDLGEPFTSSLSFVKGSISDVSIRHITDTDDVDVIVALHACDTATDDAIYWGTTTTTTTTTTTNDNNNNNFANYYNEGIKNNAEVIVTAPCCHKEIRKQIDAKFAKVSNDIDNNDDDNDDSDLVDVLRHNIFRERQSEMVILLLPYHYHYHYYYYLTTLQYHYYYHYCYYYC